MQALLDARARSTASFTVPPAPDPAARPEVDATIVKGGAVGPRDGDLDQQIQRFLGEPGISRFIADYGGRPPFAAAYAIAQTADHRIWIAGRVGGTSGSQPTRIGIIQFLANGALDHGFNVSALGRQYIDVTNPNLEPVAGVAFGEEFLGGVLYHRFYLLAEDRSNPSQYNFALLCFRRPFDANDPFEPCPGFGTGGVRYYNANLASGCGTNHSRPQGLAVAAVGSDPPRLLLLGGVQRVFNGCGDYDMAALRVDFDGNPDTTFGGFGSGWAVVYAAHDAGNPPFRGSARSAAVLASGQILLGGSVTNAGGVEHAIVGALSASGSVEMSFCHTTDATCDSLPSYRSGTRGFASLPNGVVSAIAPLSTGGIALVRERTVSSDAARVRQISASGGCAAPLGCNDLVLAPASGDAPLYARAILPRLGPGGTPLPGRFVVAGWGLNTSTAAPNDAFGLVLAVRDAGGTLAPDPEFASTPGAGHRNAISWPLAGAPTSVPRDARIFAARLDRQGRVLIAGASKADPAGPGEYDMGFARLQGASRMFADGFESP
ncbi:MAG: hypothetical protein RML12_10325 [Xanthomonadales bacterium]|nr:hypothetical protein [Xanthomonadales bacterium]